MSNAHPAYSLNAAVRGADLTPALTTINRQRMWKLAGVLTAFLVVILGLFGAEALMLSTPETAAPMENSQPGAPAPRTPD